MAQADRDDPVDPPIAPAVAAADDPPENALRATVEAYASEIAMLRAQLAERDARDAPVLWLPLKRAAGNLDMPYENARAWAERAIKAGRVNEARKIDGRVEANIHALKAYRDRLTAK
jgi:hypothetical protein